MFGNYVCVGPRLGLYWTFEFEPDYRAIQQYRCFEVSTREKSCLSCLVKKVEYEHEMDTSYARQLELVVSN